MKGNGQELRIGAFAGAVGFVAVLVTTAVFAWLIHREILGLEHLDLTSAAALIMGGLLAGFSCGRGEGRWIRAGIAGAGLILVMLAVNLICFGGSLSGVLPGCALLLGSVTAAALVMGDKKGRKRRKYQIKKYRTG